MVNEECFDYLDAPPLRVTGADVPMPYAVNLENFVVPTPENIARMVELVCARPFKK
jgi:pyruvate dehydrogenase E1 component beta subunit